MNRLHLYLMPILGIGIILLNVEAQMYRWTDEQGKVHFSDRPHKNAQVIEIRKPRSAGIGTPRHQGRTQQQVLKELEHSRRKREQQAAHNARQRAQRDQECQRLKNRLRDYEDVDYLVYRDNNGQKKRFSSEQKKHREQKLRDQIANNC